MSANKFVIKQTGFVDKQINIPVERYYRILIKTEINSEIVIFDNGNIFKVSR